ncbi:hypothetical protein PPYR_00262 [Photinus pyralis]|uniref:U3 small nucleolar ribonucleoprotein protein MPP10 n=1 Tax=Photinus pyralis TaxID=7054 RepID=A0A1Y1LR65_PHOPY|nr:U3 small nucleolar ribonucleoprotein protein MPP10-like [Photinus pyralis]XP_031355041.1 U3 small nucleolar ribonucleoprotein protein MPP10-like [Photinus pyralis]KAB0793710.1 hypothetical protein PPYR_13330 [Photinus pyralis]KAB0803292.1 hypothetical protein PPYR_00262 [Photinus pyralis]
MNVHNSVESILNVFENVVSKPESYLSAEEKLNGNIRKLLKTSYDFSKQTDAKTTSNALPELIIDNFDLEQIWQQLELQNNFILNRNVNTISKLVVSKEKLFFEETTDDVESEEPVEENVIDDGAEQSDAISELDHTDNEEHEPIPTKTKPSVVDDNFFKLDEMNNFLLSEEKKGSDNKKPPESDSESEGSVDMFKEDSDNSDDDPEAYNNKKNPRYKDFFGKSQQQPEQVEDQEDYSNDEEDDFHDHYDESNNFSNENDEIKKFKSPLELREERLNEKIKVLEDAAISDRPWQLKGEIQGENRPINSLLEEVLEYDVGSRPAPVITEATTVLLEDAIKQRIKDKCFDDVERKEKPVDTPLEYKKKLVLDQEKSKQSLAQIYEKEFLQQRDALQATEEKEEEEPALHKEIKSMLSSLFSKLDALSNFHFTPKPVAPELRVVNNLPAINMEEVAPVAMTNASLLAPEEVKVRSKGQVIGKDERSKTDKKRERRKKKSKQSEHAQQKMKMTLLKKPGLGNKYSKEKMKKMIEQVSKDTNVDKMDEVVGSKRIKSSSAFFTQLQEQVSSQIKNTSKTHKKIKKQTFNAKQLKL